MRKAFDINNGPLTDGAAEAGERQALSDLFAGAIGTYKNAQSHRKVGLDDPDEAAESSRWQAIFFGSWMRAGRLGGTMNHLGSGHRRPHTALVAAAGERAEEPLPGILRRQHPQQAYAARLREGDAGLSHMVR